MEELPAPPEGGWRDEPVEGNRCGRCDGWGSYMKQKPTTVTMPDGKTVEADLPDRRVTCELCRGTGRAPWSADPRGTKRAA